MTAFKIFSYDWGTKEYDDETTILLWGLTPQNEPALLNIKGFRPYLYLEIKNKVLTRTEFKRIKSKIEEMCKSKNILYNINIECQFVDKKKLYYADINKDGTRKITTFLRISFDTRSKLRKFQYSLKRKGGFINIGASNYEIKLHEHNADDILQLTSNKNLPTAGWINCLKIADVDEKQTNLIHEYDVNYKHIEGDFTSEESVNPMIMSFDIEVNSSIPNKFPSAQVKEDTIFQICCNFNIQGSTNYKTFLLSLGEPDDIHNTTILTYKKEYKLLEGFKELIKKHNPQVIIGYNILGFDIPYMIDRSKLYKINGDSYFNIFSKCGCFKNKSCKEKSMKWSSSAYRTQEFLYIELDGRIWVDLLPVIKRDYRFSDYKLKTVSTFFLGETKDPLTAKDIFKCYRKGMEGGEEGRKMLNLVGKYCVQDTVLVTKLFEKVQTWVGLCEMAKTCNVPIFYLIIRGQQVKVFSQVYKNCLKDNFVVEHEGYIPKDDEEYTGATVFPPKPGLYEKVIPFDFASLYPTTIIAYNIDYSTLVVNEDILDDKCHIIEWEDHVGCEHDKEVRKTKVSKVICAKNRYRFLKEPKGVIPTLLEYLLDTRKKTKNKMKKLKGELKEIEDDEVRRVLEKKIVILDKRQLAYKISANSMYGSMGVKRGYLPFLPGAMCTTAKGRDAVTKAAAQITRYHDGELIYGDTDSCYIHFPNLSTSQECWDHSVKVEEEVSSLYPKPMKLEFEEAIYWKFFILSKKRYMALSCDRDGIFKRNKNGGLEIEKKGVVLARRDNSEFVRNFYEHIIMDIFNHNSDDDINYKVITTINQLCCGYYSSDNFIITKAINGEDEYKVKELPDESKVKSRLSELGIGIEDKDIRKLKEYELMVNGDNEEDEGDKSEFLLRYKDIKGIYEEYRCKCLPAHIQLAIKLRDRGIQIAVGSRMEYVVVVGKGHLCKQYDKLEEPQYKKRYGWRKKNRIDYMHYLKTSSPPIDQLLKTKGLNINKGGNEREIGKMFEKGSLGYLKNRTSGLRGGVMEQYNYRLKIRNKVLDDIRTRYYILV